LDSLDLFNKLPLEKSPLYTKYVDMISGLKLDSIQLALPSRDMSVPGEVKHLMGDHDEQTLALQVDSQIVRTQVHGGLEKEGIIFTDLQSALTKFPDLVKSHFSKAVRPDDDKFAALNNAFYTTGIFLYVPKGLSIKVPFRNIVLVKSHGIGAFSHNIIVADENSKVTFLQEAYSKLDPAKQGPTLYSEVTEVFLQEGAEVNFASVQNFESDIHAFVNRRSLGQKDSRVNWTIGHIGGGITRSRMDSALDGPGSTAEDVEIVFGAEAQRFDIVTDLSHVAPHTTGHVRARGVLRDSSRSVFKGMIRIGKGAKNSNSYLAEHAMILSKKARADAIPGLEIETIGNAKKVFVDTNFDKVNRHLNIINKYKIELRRPYYYDILSKIDGRKVVVGDIFSIDLALPKELGIPIILKKNYYTPMWSRMYVGIVGEVVNDMEQLSKLDLRKLFL